MPKNKYNDNHAPLYTPRKSVERSFSCATDEGYFDLICAILEQAIIDWDLLERGNLGVTRANNQYVFRAEVESFLKSEWFDELLAYALPQYSPQEIRAFIKVDEPERRKEDAHIRTI